jgi:RNA polymerase sigma-70 factor (ECF subfamily)
LKTLRWETDRELLFAAVEGNVAATTEIVELLSNDGIRQAWRYLGSIEDAEDIVQESFMKLWQSYRDFKGDAKLKTYFYTIVQRACFDQLKKNRQQWDLGDFDFDTLMSENSNNSQEERDADGMMKAIHQLPPKQRIAIILWAYYDNTAEEIGQKLEMSKNAVDQLLHRAKANLRLNFVH